MASPHDDESPDSPDASKDSGLDKSFVSKFMSGLINSTPLSKWFNKDTNASIIRKRSEDDDGSFNLQPPSKRARVPEPTAGPSGLRPPLKRFPTYATTSTNTMSSGSFGAINGGESDSGESSSGYISGSKRMKDKDTSKVRSLFINSETNPSSLSSRRPAFDASPFGSPNFVDRTLSTQQILKSPFYSGPTTYGGASAYGRRLTRSIDDERSRTSVQIKPLTNQTTYSDTTTLSKTARRILNTLEQYSTPISDVKKIPIVPKRSTSGLLTPYIIRDRKRGSNQELQIPTVPDLLQMKQKQRLQASTESVREMAKKSKSNLNRQEYHLHKDEEKTEVRKKIKNHIGAVRQKVALEVVPEVQLPKITLPITDLPKFDFVPMEKPKEQVTKPMEKSDFTFAQPVVISNTPAVSTINCFKFSEPVNATKIAKKTIVKNNGENILNKFKLKSEQWECQCCWVRNDQSIGKCAACGTNKVVANLDQFKPLQNTWECPVCMIRNQNDVTKCAACATLKVVPINNKKDTWECTTCLIRNQNEKEKCEACSMPKPKKTVTFSTTNTNIPFNVVRNDWECQTCLIRNSNDLSKCAACESPKTGGSFGDAFKKKTSQWECGSCMVQNENTTDQCVCCGAPKPGSKSTKLKINFGMDKATASKFKFGIPLITTTEEVKVTTVSITTTTASSSAITLPTTTTSTTFSFGIPPKIDSVPINTANFLLKPEEKLPEKVEPAASDFKFSVPTFEFKPPAINGDLNKSSPVKPLFEVTAPKQPQETIPIVVTSEKKLEVFSNSTTTTTTKPAESFITKPIESLFGTVTSTSDTSSKLAFGVKFTEAPSFGVTSSEPAFGIATTSKPVESLFATKPFSTTPKTTVETNFGNKSTDLPFGGVNKMAETTPFNVPIHSPFNSTTKPVVSPFAVKSPPKIAESPFGTTLQKTNSPFSSTTTLAKPSIFSSTTKPSDNIFATTDTNIKSDLFATTGTKRPSTASFNFTPQKTEQQMFKFAADTKITPITTNGFPVATSTTNKIAPFFGETTTTTTTAAAAKPFSFGGDKPASTGFSFGNTAPTPSVKPAAPVFSFGSANAKVAPPAAAAPGGFNFTAPPPSNTGFNFVASPAPAAPVVTSKIGDGGVFGSGSGGSSSTFGSGSATTSFNFGGANSGGADKAVFSFGAGSSSGTAPPPAFGVPQQQTGFAFGSSQQLSAPPSTFNFSGAPPSFNFTDGNTTQSQPRKIKRAVRRTNR